MKSKLFAEPNQSGSFFTARGAGLAAGHNCFETVDGGKNMQWPQSLAGKAGK